jgi:hypothetical protein
MRGVESELLCGSLLKLDKVRKLGADRETEIQEERTEIR